MTAFRSKGFTYDLYVKPWKKGKYRYECLRWETGFRNFWERISYEEFEKARVDAGGEN